MSDHLDPPADLIRVLRCPDCGKQHAVAGMSEATRCGCGRKLWPLVWTEGR